MLDKLFAPLRHLGHSTINAIWKLGVMSRFLLAIIAHSGQSLLRFQLTIREVYFAGVLSLIIIVVSGLFVGMVLGLQGYNTLSRFGSADALGALVALVAPGLNTLKRGVPVPGSVALKVWHNVKMVPSLEVRGTAVAGVATGSVQLLKVPRKYQSAWAEQATRPRARARERQGRRPEVSIDMGVPRCLTFTAMHNSGKRAVGAQRLTSGNRSDNDFPRWCY